MKRTLTLGATLVALASAGACGSDDAGKGGKDGVGQSKKDALPHADSLRDIQDFLGTYVDCSALSTDKNDDRLNGTYLDWLSDDPSEAEKRAAAAWGIKEEGVCGEKWTNSYVVYLPKNMKQFQRNYKTHNADSADGTGKFYVGDNFAVDFSGGGSGGLERTGLLNLNCDPSFAPPSGYKKKQALVDGCVLTDFTGS
ncbi:hypothetical protein ABZU86_00115 [Streptomyces sp. NPDC005271]